MREHEYAVIMAGGGGTRLWPLSHKAQPKQMLKLNGKQTLYQMAVERLAGIFAPDHIYVVTVAEQAAALQAQVPQVPTENYLLEPLPRGTASVVGMAAVALRRRDPDAVMTVLTADHFIENTAAFQGLLRAASLLAEQNYLVTLGVRPTFAATGYGYIQRGEPLGEYAGLPAFVVKKFKEKPDEAQAAAFLAGGDHDWNSGMFIWRVDRILEELRRYMPDLATVLDPIDAAWNTPRRVEVIQALWPDIQPQSVDYGIMEKAEHVAVLPAADLGWNDVGSWDSLFGVLPKDENGNIILDAEHIGLNTSDTLVCAEHPDRLIVTIGARNLIIVDTGRALLICPRDDAQRVKEIVNLLKKMGREAYL